LTLSLFAKKILSRRLAGSLKEVGEDFLHSAREVLLNLDRRRKQKLCVVEGFFFDNT
jgi:hypothetical protein